MKAVFVDRDGTLNVNTGYVGDPADVVLIPNAAEGLRQLAAAGYAIIVVSNQSGIGRGYFTPAAADAVDARVRDALAEHGATITAMYRCPHSPEAKDQCDCRKPKPGMLLRAAAELGIDLEQSWTIGDRVLDMQAGLAAGTRCVSVPGVPPHAPPEDFAVAPPEYQARDLMDAARFIVAQSAQTRPAGAAR